MGDRKEQMIWVSEDAHRGGPTSWPGGCGDHRDSGSGSNPNKDPWDTSKTAAEQEKYLPSVKVVDRQGASRQLPERVNLKATAMRHKGGGREETFPMFR